MKLFLGFDFYGAGNIGDDLMLAGFLSTIRDQLPAEIVCAIPRAAYSQRHRFPEITWYRDNEQNRANLIAESNLWVGVGDTPFQIRSGMWFLRKILRDIEHIRVCSIPMYMIGVGAEMEVVSAKDTVCQILAEIEHIWTRDGSTTDLLIRRLGVSPLKVTTGADLANIALKNIFSKVAPDNHRKYELAVTYYAEDVARSDIKELRNFLECISKEKSVIFVANETRKDRHFEYGIYRSMFGRLRNLYKPCPVSLFSPDYETASLPELVTHFQNYKVVMASRYHALLAAAWAGCKIVALARSSKVEHLG